MDKTKVIVEVFERIENECFFVKRPKHEKSVMSGYTEHIMMKHGGGSIMLNLRYF